MTRRAGGIDYRVAEWFLMAKEHLRQSVLSYNSANVNSLCVTNKLLELMGFPLESLPPHVEKFIEILRILPGDEKSRWFDLACRSLEETYARIHINEINNSTVEAK